MTPLNLRSTNAWHAAQRLSVFSIILLLGLLGPAGQAMADKDADDLLDERIEAAEDWLDDSPHDLDRQLYLAKLLHLKATQGHESSGKRSLDYLNSLHDAYPDHAVIKAYLGSAKMLKAKRIWAVWKKGDLVETGGDLILAAEDMDSENLEIQFIKAISVYRLPRWMEQFHIAKETFHELSLVAEEAAADGRLSAEQAASTLYHEAEIQLENGHKQVAKDLYYKAIELSPDSFAAEDSHKALKKLKK